MKDFEEQSIFQGVHEFTAHGRMLRFESDNGIWHVWECFDNAWVFAMHLKVPRNRKRISNGVLFDLFVEHEEQSAAKAAAQQLA